MGSYVKTYNIMGQPVMGWYPDASPEERSASLGLGTAGSAGLTGAASAPKLNLTDERNSTLSLLQQIGQIYNGGDFSKLQQLLMDRAEGRSQPFGQNVLQTMLGQNAAGANAGFQSDSRMIRQNMANSGMSGSGIENRALLNAQARARQQAMAGRAQINSRAHLENFAALERAQQQAQAYLAQRAAMQQQALQGEAEYRGRSTASETQGGGSAPAGGTTYGVNPSASPQRQQNMDMSYQQQLMDMYQDFFRQFQPQGATTESTTPTGAAPNPLRYSDPYRSGFSYNGSY